MCVSLLCALQEQSDRKHWCPCLNVSFFVYVAVCNHMHVHTHTLHFLAECLCLCVCEGLGVRTDRGTLVWREGGTATVAISLQQPMISPPVLALISPGWKPFLWAECHSSPHLLSPLQTRQRLPHDACTNNHTATLRGRYAYLHILCAFMSHTEEKICVLHRATQGPSIHQLYDLFSFLRLCKNVIQALSSRQEDLSVVISL